VHNTNYPMAQDRASSSKVVNIDYPIQLQIMMKGPENSSFYWCKYHNRIH